MDHSKFISKCRSKYADGGEIVEKPPTPPEPEQKKGFFEKFFPTPGGAYKNIPKKKPGIAASERADAVKNRSSSTLKDLGED